MRRPDYSDLASAIVTALLCIAILLIAYGLTGCGKSESRSGGNHPAFVARFTVTGNSMYPLFANGEEAALILGKFSEVTAQRPVVTWHAETKQFIVHMADHRDERSNLWITRGINNPGEDFGRMTADEFVGFAGKLAKP